MTCTEAKEWIAAAWQSPLDAASERALSEHLANCAECRSEKVVLDGLWHRLGELPAPEPVRTMWMKPPRRLAWRVPVWQVAAALACMVAGFLAGHSWPQRNDRQNTELAKLQAEIASTRALVALSLLQQQSATERLRGIDFTGQLASPEPAVTSALIQVVEHDPSVNVRLAALDALTRQPHSRASMVDTLARTLPRQDSPLVQAALIDSVVDAGDRGAVPLLRQLETRPDLNPAVRQRALVALQQLSR